VPTALTWGGGADPRQVNGQIVGANYFDVLGLPPAAGRFFLPDEDMKLNGNTVAVISHSFWVNKLGSSELSPRSKKVRCFLSVRKQFILNDLFVLRDRAGDSRCLS